MKRQALETYRVKIRGIRPLLMNSPQSMLEEANKQKKRAGEKPDPETEAKSKLYKNPKTGEIAVPSYVVKACITEASKDYKVPGRGKKTFKDFVRAGLVVEPEWIPLKHNGWEIDLRPVVVQRSRIIRARPRFDEWELEFNVHIVDPIITGDYLKEFLETAGKYRGLLDFRPEYGLFEVVEFERIKTEENKS